MAGDVAAQFGPLAGGQQPALDADLRTRGVSTLVMAGISTTGVVLSSVAWASDADYDVRLVQDCCYDPDRDAHEALLRSGFGGRVQVV